ncbi:MAG: protein phosphatase 2C domain-containing protein [Actinomycetota bacterium]
MLISNFHSAGRTDVGRTRSANQDQYLVADLSKTMTIHSTTLPVDDETELYAGLRAPLLLVADGISGQRGGNVASQIGVGTTAAYVLNTMPWFFSLTHDHDDDQQDELVAAVAECERAVEMEAAEHPELAGMGTTLTMACLIWPRMYVVNVGDSRCYLLRNGTLSQLTHDHTAAQHLVDDGTFTAEQAARSPLSHVLVHSIGRPSAFRPEVTRTDLEPGDRVLLCTDGLSSQVDDARIAELLGGADSAEEATDALVDAANDAGGADNVTAVVSFCFPPIER